MNEPERSEAFGLQGTQQGKGPNGQNSRGDHCSGAGCEPRKEEARNLRDCPFPTLGTQGYPLMSWTLQLQ